MSKGWKEYFYLNRGEQRAMLVLIAVILVVYGMLIFSLPQSGKQAVDSVAFAKDIKAFKKEIDKSKAVGVYPKSGTNFTRIQNSSTSSFKMKPLTPFLFDPNTLDEKGWMKMGLPEKLIHTILNYTSKGGHFYKPEDLQKIYGLTTEQYLALESFISIAPKVKSVSVVGGVKTPKYEKPVVQAVELNSVDSSGLDDLRGIGPVFARRILKFRDILGGYSKKEQLLEVFGMDSTLYTMILPFVKVDPDKIKKMDLNQCPMPALRKHPYIGYYLAKAIADYRVKHLKFRSVDEVRLLPGMTPEKFNQLSPYLIVIE